ncbi:polysaccharide deacetylase family protein [Capnocytophaga sp. oral taxon 338]|jgi:hypothetical protein|uniref:polysaccharide deacetylase family protein n=1 Tax=Capnocytophaga sp. oral taxon 338 TaxID=710239 RepID=UPI00058F3999|nr:polysaccharide deacetylase family protein [Capnocytophaga sp. oral taxon 338]
MLLIYTEKKSPRFMYICEHIFINMLGLSIEITTDLETFVKSDESKLSYAKSPIGSEFFIKNFGLLFQKGVQPIELLMEEWEGIPYFFATKKGSLPFDILSASFFLLTRYEEYLHHEKNPTQPFTATNSIGYQYHFLEIPIVDIWVSRLKKALQEKYPNLEFASGEGATISVIEVAKAFKYKHKGILRTLLRGIAYFFTLQWTPLRQLIRVVIGKRKDPYDFYEALIAYFEEKKLHPTFFFLLGDYNYYDQGLSYNNVKYKYLIKHVADYAIVSVLGSYDAIFHQEILSKERERMINIINRPVRRFRSNNNLLPLPELYRNLADSEFKEDYTMCYPTHLGFRSGTCTPYIFYDIRLEVQIPILVHTCVLHWQQIDKQCPKEMFYKIEKIKQQTQELGGNFVSIFSPEYLSKAPNRFSIYKTIQEY